MVNRGYIPVDRAIPSPDMSFVRLFSDRSAGWQLRGQYAFWSGASDDDRWKYLLLERFGKKVAPMRYDDGRHAFHQISAGTTFIVTGLTGFWFTFDTDAMWIDVPHDKGQYSVLAVGGAAGKPGSADIDWACPRCGSSIAKRRFAIEPLGLVKFLDAADAYAAEFNTDTKLRTCGDCGTEHPPVPGLIREEAELNAGEGARA